MGEKEGRCEITDNGLGIPDKKALANWPGLLISSVKQKPTAYKAMGMSVGFACSF